MGAALTGALHDARAMAVSLDVGLDPRQPPQWQSTSLVLQVVLPLLRGCAPGSVLNVNVPDRAPGTLGGLRSVRLARFGTVQNRIEQLDGGGLRRAPAEVEGGLEPGSDAAMLAAGHVTGSAVQPVTAARTPLPAPLPELPAQVG